jgi:hypothetical protein
LIFLLFLVPVVAVVVLLVAGLVHPRTSRRVQSLIDGVFSEDG